MVELIAEMLIYIGLAALLGLVLGYLIWGWGTAARVSAARAEGAAAARTSVDGSAGLSEQLQESEEERRRQAEEIEHLLEQLDEARKGAPDPKASSAPLAVVSISTPDDDVSPIPDATDDAEADIYARFRDSIRQTEPDEAADNQSETPEQVQPERTDELEDATTPEASQEPAPGQAVPVGLLAERPDEVDDLKQIKGVGKVMERVLNEKGIYLFDQLASLSEQEVAWVNDAIDAFPGRIHRDRWVDQARDLHVRKYGQPFDQDG